MFGNQILGDSSLVFWKAMENPCFAIVNPWGLGSVEILIFGDFFIGFWNTHVFGFTHRYLFFSTLRIDNLICTNIDVRSLVKNPCSKGNEKSSICKFVTCYQMCAYFSFLIPVLKSYGLFDYSKKWELRSLVLSLSVLTTLVSFRSHSIQFIVSAQNTWRLIAILFGKSLREIFWHYIMFRDPTKLWIYLPKLLWDRHHFLISKLILLDPYQFEGDCEG